MKKKKIIQSFYSALYVYIYLIFEGKTITLSLKSYAKVASYANMYFTENNNIV